MNNLKVELTKFKLIQNFISMIYFNTLVNYSLHQNVQCKASLYISNCKKNLTPFLLQVSKLPHPFVKLLKLIEPQQNYELC